MNSTKYNFISLCRCTVYSHSWCCPTNSYQRRQWIAWMICCLKSVFNLQQ